MGDDDRSSKHHVLFCDEIVVVPCHILFDMSVFLLFTGPLTPIVLSEVN